MMKVLGWVQFMYSIGLTCVTSAIFLNETSEHSIFWVDFFNDDDDWWQ